MECFSVLADEIEGRIDPHFYRPMFIRFYQHLEKTRFKFKTIGEIAEKVTSGATPLSKGDAYISKEKGIPFIRSGDINEDKNINFDEVLYIKDNIHNKLLKGSKLKKGDILIAIVGATIGQISIYDYEKEANINQAIALVRIKQGINPEYVKAFMISTIGQKQLDRIKRPVARANINLDEIRSIKTILPSLTIQNKIVALTENAYKEKKNKENKISEFLDSINDYVLGELGIKLPELKDKMVHIVNSDEIEGRIDPLYYKPEFIELKKQLRSVNSVLFGSLIDIITKGETPLWRGDTYEKEGIPFLKVQNISINGIKGELTYISEYVHKRMKRSQLNGGELLYTMAGSIGIATILPEDFGRANINQAISKIVVKEKVNKNYLIAILNSSICLKQTQRMLTTSAQPNINFEQIKSIKIPLPPLVVQNKIAEEVKRRMQRAEQLQKEVKEDLEVAKKEVEKIILGEK